MTEQWKKEISNFESDLKNVPDSHKANVLNLYLINTHEIKKVEELYEDINKSCHGFGTTRRRSFNLTTVIWKNFKYLEKYLKIVITPRHEIFFQDMYHLKKFMRKNKCIVQLVKMFEYTDASESELPFYQLAYYNNTNIFKYYLQYLPFFKRKSVDNYVPRKFPSDSCPHK